MTMTMTKIRQYINDNDRAISFSATESQHQREKKLFHDYMILFYDYITHSHEKEARHVTRRGMTNWMDFLIKMSMDAILYIIYEMFFGETLIKKCEME